MSLYCVRDSSQSLKLPYVKGTSSWYACWSSSGCILLLKVISRSSDTPIDGPFDERCSSWSTDRTGISHHEYGSWRFAICDFNGKGERAIARCTWRCPNRNYMVINSHMKFARGIFRNNYLLRVFNTTYWLRLLLRHSTSLLTSASYQMITIGGD